MGTMTRAILAIAFWLAVALVGVPRPAAGQSASAIYDSTGRFVGLWAGTPTRTGGIDVHSLRGFRFAVNLDGRITEQVDYD